MNRSQFNPRPDEFNKGYQGGTKKEEKEKSKDKLKIYQRARTFLATTLIILPLTVNVGLWTLTSFQFGPGLYKAEDHFLCLEEDNDGWLFDGNYFVPLLWNNQSKIYEVQGAYPASAKGGLAYAEYYLLNTRGRFEVEEKYMSLIDPFTQESADFYPVKNKNLDPESYAIDAYNDNNLTLQGKWAGLYRPATEYPSAYPSRLTIRDGGYAYLGIGNTVNNNEIYVGMTWKLEGSHLIFTYDGAIDYSFEADGKTLRFVYDRPLEGIIFFTEDGAYIALNVFASQIFKIR